MSEQRDIPELGASRVDGEKKSAPYLRRALLPRVLSSRTEYAKGRLLVISTIGLYVMLFFWVLIRGAEVVSIASIHTELVSFDAVDPRKAAFHIEEMKAAPLGTSEPASCLSGLVTPAKDAIVTYGRIGDGPVEITIAPPETEQSSKPVGTFEPDDGRSARLLRGTYYITGRGCPKAIAIRLPIWGRVRIGEEFRPATGGEAPEPSLLIDGDLTVAAHALWTHALYQVTTLAVPVGARLETYYRQDDAAPPWWRTILSWLGMQSQSGRRGPAIWWGTAYVDPQRTALVAALGTEAPEIALYRPNQTHADIIRVSGLAQLTDDPFLLRLHIALLVLIAWVIFLEWIGRHWQDIAGS